MASIPEHIATETLLSDELLIGRVASADSAALEQLYARHGRVVYGLALRMLANPEHAEEVVQETFWRVWRRANSFQATSGSFMPWLFGIARNLCIDELRRLRSRPAPAPTDEEVLAAIPNTEPAVEQLSWEAERRRLISSALNELPPEQRQVLELAYFSGLSQREIAEQLAHPLGTIKTRVRLALQKLKTALQQQGISLEDH